MLPVLFLLIAEEAVAVVTVFLGAVVVLDVGDKEEDSNDVSTNFR